jgi:uncharacterized protein (TIRG00374 family)
VKRLSFLLKLAITMAILYWIASNIDWKQLGSYFHNMSLTWYGGAALAVLFSYLLTGIRWFYLLKIQGINLPLMRVQNLTFIGMFFNVFLLGSTGGDLTKLYYVNRYVPQKKTKIVVSILMDRGIGLLMLIALALPFLPYEISTLSQTQDSRLYASLLLILFVGGCLGLLLFLLFPIRYIPVRLRQWAVNHPRMQLLLQFLDSIRQHGKSGKLTALAFVLSIFSQFLNILSGYLLAIAVGIPMTFSQCSIMIAIVFTLISLPISIGGHGVRELAFIKLFAIFGIIASVSDNDALIAAATAYSLLLFSFQLLWGLVGGIVYMSSSHHPSLAQLHES